jgi:hypothetical protein
LFAGGNGHVAEHDEQNNRDGRDPEALGKTEAKRGDEDREEKEKEKDAVRPRAQRDQRETPGDVDPVGGGGRNQLFFPAREKIDRDRI